MASYEKTGYDVEYNAPYTVGEKRHSVIAPDQSGAVHGESFVAGDTLYARLQRLAGRFGVEQRGIERVPEDERTDKSTFKVGTMVRQTTSTISERENGSLCSTLVASSQHGRLVVRDRCPRYPCFCTGLR